MFKKNKLKAVSLAVASVICASSGLEFSYADPIPTKTSTVKLGSGYFPLTQTNMGSYQVDEKSLISTSDDTDDNKTKSVVEQSSTVGVTLAKAGVEKSSEIKSKKASAGGGSNVAVGNGSVKVQAAADWQSDSMSHNGEKSIDIGFQQTRTMQLPVNSSKDTQKSSIAIRDTKTALEAANPNIREALQKIDIANPGEDKEKAIRDFYSNFGTHFVSNVEKGRLGGLTVDISLKDGTEKDSFAGNLQITPSSLLKVFNAQASGGYNSEFKNSDFNITVKRWSQPYDPKLENALIEEKDDIEKAINDDGGVGYSTMSSVTFDSIKNEIPPLPSIDDCEIPEEKKKEVKEIYKALENANKYIGLQEEEFNRVEKKPENLSVFQSIQTNLKEQFSNGEYKGTTAFMEEKDLNNYYSLLNNLSITIQNLENHKGEPQKDLTTLIDKKIKEFEDKEAERKKRNEEFKDKQIPTLTQYICEEKGWEDNKLTTERINTLSEEEIEDFSRAYREMFKTDLNGVEVSDIIIDNPSRNDMLLSANNHSSNDDNEMVTVDFDIVPWTVLYPQLNIPYVDETVTLLKTKLYLELAKEMTIYEYAKFLNNEPDLSKLIEGEVQQRLEFDRTGGGAYNQLQDLYKESLKEANHFDEDALKKMYEKLEKLQNISELSKTNWYKVASKLYDDKLILPDGTSLQVNYTKDSKGKDVTKNHFVTGLDYISSISSGSINTSFINHYNNESTPSNGYSTFYNGYKDKNMPTYLIVVTSDSYLEGGVAKNIEIMGKKGSGRNGIKSWSYEYVPLFWFNYGNPYRSYHKYFSIDTNDSGSNYSNPKYKVFLSTEKENRDIKFLDEVNLGMDRKIKLVDIRNSTQKYDYQGNMYISPVDIQNKVGIYNDNIPEAKFVGHYNAPMNDVVAKMMLE